MIRHDTRQYEDGYEDGYEVGCEDGYEAYLNDNVVVTSKQIERLKKVFELNNELTAHLIILSKIIKEQLDE